MGNILICLEKMDIGGVETAVLNQAITLKQEKQNVVVIAEKGKYMEQLEEYGIVCEEFRFELMNQYDLKGAERIMEIIDKYQIDQVYIHQFGCILSALPACLTKNIPYIAVINAGRNEVYDWYINTYPIYQYVFIEWLINAHLIIAITEKVKEYTSQRFKIPLEKYRIAENSLNFELYKNENIIETEDIAIVSRLDADKYKSIICAIDFAVKYSRQVQKKIRILVVGSGNREEEIKQYVEEHYNEMNIEFLGFQSNIPNVLRRVKIVIGMGRCILEAIAMKRIAIISGYEELKTIVYPEKIEMLKEENFTGRQLKGEKEETIINQLKQMNKEEVHSLTEKNYQHIYERLNIKKNLYYLEENTKTSYDLRENFKHINMMQNEIEENQRKIEESQKEIQEKQKEINQKKCEIEEKDKKIQELEKEIEKIYHSRTWKIRGKIRKILRREK